MDNHLLSAKIKDTHGLSRNFLPILRIFEINVRMSTYARALLIPTGTDCVVHAVIRCVRRAWLCGVDPYTGKDFEHRRQWMRERLQHLAKVFAIEVCAYSIMSNHSYFVLWCRPSLAAEWSPEEVARRWLQVFGCHGAEPGESAVQRLAGNAARIAEIRARLGSVSWFMRSLNEWIARKANSEDECTGRFWEGRFKCQLLEDDGAVLACMAYVDLNPVRAKMAQSLESSEFTSVYDRITARQARAELAALQAQDTSGETDFAPMTPEQSALVAQAREEAGAAAWLCPFDQNNGHTLLALREEDYLKLRDWTGRCFVHGKQGALPEGMPPLLEKMELDVEQWVESVRRYGGLFHRVAGKLTTLRRKAHELGQHWLVGVRACRCVFREAAAG